MIPSLCAKNRTYFKTTLIMVAGCWYTPLQIGVYHHVAAFYHGSRTVSFVHPGQCPDEGPARSPDPLRFGARTWWPSTVPSPCPRRRAISSFWKCFFPPSVWKAAAKRRCIITRPPSQNCCKSLISALRISPRTICASIWPIIIRPVIAAAAISTISVASFPASLMPARRFT